MRYDFGARTHIGGGLVQEDGVLNVEFDSGNSIEMFAVLDGSGSVENLPHAESLIMQYLRDTMRYQYKAFGHDEFVKHIPSCMEIAVNVCNVSIGAFKIKNENEFANFGASMTAVTLYGSTMYLVHGGNTRLYRLRNGKIQQMTLDHTKAYDAVMQGLLDMDKYYASTDRGILTGGIYGGLALFGTDIFRLNKAKMTMKKDDIYCLTTDGVHYVINEDAIRTIILQSQTCGNAAENLIEASRELGTQDNASAIVFRPIFFNSEEEIPSFETDVV